MVYTTPVQGKKPITLPPVALLLYIELELYTLVVSLPVLATHCLISLKIQHSKPNMSQLVLLSYCSVFLSLDQWGWGGRLVDLILTDTKVTFIYYFFEFSPNMILLSLNTREIWLRTWLQTWLSDRIVTAENLQAVVTEGFLGCFLFQPGGARLDTNPMWLLHAMVLGLGMGLGRSLGRRLYHPEWCTLLHMWFLGTQFWQGLVLPASIGLVCTNVYMDIWSHNHVLASFYSGMPK